MKLEGFIVMGGGGGESLMIGTMYETHFPLYVHFDAFESPGIYRINMPRLVYQYGINIILVNKYSLSSVCIFT